MIVAVKGETAETVITAAPRPTESKPAPSPNTDIAYKPPSKGTPPNAVNLAAVAKTPRGTVGEKSPSMSNAAGAMTIDSAAVAGMPKGEESCTAMSTITVENTLSTGGAARTKRQPAGSTRK